MCAPNLELITATVASLPQGLPIETEPLLTPSSAVKSQSSNTLPYKGTSLPELTPLVAVK